MTARKPLYLIVSGRDGGSGSIGSPPGDPKLTYSVHGYWGGRRKPSGPDLIASLDYLLSDEDRDVPPELKARAQRLIDEAAAQRTVPSEEWVRHTYGYFAHSYSPDGVDRNVSNAVTSSMLHCKCGEEFWNEKGLTHHLKRHPVDMHHHQVTKPLPPAGHHLGYLAVREYYPDHQPRLDLIADPGRTSGPCDKCGEQVQYEARHDAYCKVTVQPWSWDPDCPEGGHHERAPYPDASCPDCGCDKA